jgi:adenylate kinase
MHSILITGVCASGKSTLSREAARILGLASYDYADLMLKAEPGLPGKDAIEALSAGERQAIYDKVSVELPSWFGHDSGSPETVLLENHLSVIQDGRIVTFQTTAYRCYSARGLAVISADPAGIHARRSSDPARQRSPGTVAQIARQQAVNQSQATVVAEYLAIPLLVVRNDDVATAAADLAHWAQGLLP